MKLLIGSFCKILSFAISSLPTRLRLWLGDLLGLLWFDVFRIRRKVAVENVAIAFPQMPLKERERIARASLRSMGRTLTEYCLFPFLTPEKASQIFTFEGYENVERALAGGKGVLFLTLHLGNGDFLSAGLALMKKDTRFHLISKEFKSRWLNELWFDMRRRLGTRFISPEKSTFEILRALKRNEVVMFVLDQFMGPPIGVRTRFFGRETGTAAGLALIAERTGAPVIPCYGYRRDDGSHVAVFQEPVEHLDDRLTEKNIAAMTQIYTDKIEAMVRRCPGQWMWIHRRWKEFRE